MSWEEDYKHERPCFCGKGTLVSWSRSDDWNRRERGEYLTCEECKQKYVYAFIDPYSEARRKTDGCRWITKEEFADYQKQQEEEKAREKELHVQELQQQLDGWKGRHSLEWFKLMDEYMRLQGKSDTAEYDALLEEFHQYEIKLDARHQGRTKPRRPLIGRESLYES